MFRRSLKTINLLNFRRQTLFDAKFNPSVDYYGKLGVSRTATDDEIKKAFYKLAKEYHPDSKKGFEDKFKEVNEAYTVLSDPKTRRQYDGSSSFSAFKDHFNQRSQSSRRGSRSEDTAQQSNYTRNAEYDQFYRTYSDNFNQQSQNFRYAYQDLSEQERKSMVDHFSRVMMTMLIVGIVFGFFTAAIHRQPVHSAPKYVPHHGPYRGQQESHNIWQKVGQQMSNQK